MASDRPPPKDKNGERGGGGADRWGKSLVDGKKRWRDGGLESRGVLVLRVVKRGDKGNGERAKREQ